jgi:site-specific DNA recombinase
MTKPIKANTSRLFPPHCFSRHKRSFAALIGPKYRKHNFAFAGLLNCAHDDCMVTAEIQKQKYIYYRCTGYRGKCALPFRREEESGKRLGQLFQDIYIPDDVLTQVVGALGESQSRSHSAAKEQHQKLEQRLSAVCNRMDQAYSDKLDGVISAEFWQRKTAEWKQE